MPADTPPVFRIECERYGAHVTLVDGLIDACGRIVAERAAAEGWHDVSTLKEPYRVEGKKTMGYELAEDFGWELPDAILYPTGGGTGLIGMWKAFDEMEALGWIGAEAAADDLGPGGRLRADPARRSREGKDVSEKWENARDLRVGAPRPEGLRGLPDPVGHPRLRRDGDRRDGRRDARARATRSARPRASSPRPRAAPSGPRRRRSGTGRLDPESRVVLFNTGTGFKYL